MGYLESVLDQSLAEIPEMTLLYEDELDREYNLRIVGADVRTSDAGNDYIRVQIENIDREDTYDVYENLMLPRKDQTDKEKAMRLDRIREFCDAFGVPIDFDVEVQEGDRVVLGWEGAVGVGILGFDEGGDNYRPKNTLRQVISGA